MSGRLSRVSSVLNTDCSEPKLTLKVARSQESRFGMVHFLTRSTHLNDSAAIIIFYFFAQRFSLGPCLPPIASSFANRAELLKDVCSNIYMLF